jgi:uncharacterized transporter YbjL
MSTADLGNRSYGKYASISNGPWKFIGAHLSGFARSGGNVQKGSLIGFVGSTGRSTGPHLHAEFRNQGKAVNPRKVLAFAKGGITGANHLSLVGEAGPEIVKLPAGSKVHSNRQSQSMLSNQPIVIENHIEIGGEVVRVVQTEINQHDIELSRKIRAGHGRRR